MDRRLAPWLRAGIGCAGLGLTGLAAGAQVAGADKPLPSLPELRARAIANFQASEAAKERYLCREKITTQELNGKGEVKKTDWFEREIFFVHGVQISHRISENGRPLSAAEQKKQMERVEKRIDAAGKKKPGGDGDVSVGEILKYSQLEHERRISVSGRPTIVFDVTPNPHPKTKAFDVAAELVAAMEGTVSIDEATGSLQDVNTRGARDVKVGGGLLANVHKGFAVHVLLGPQPDGVWLLRLVEGQGDARVGLFLHPYGRFRQETEGCKLTDVQATQSGDEVRTGGK